jgi:hypothetical protein
LPQGYLRGFIDPARKDKKKYPKPLWCFDLQANRWRERNPKEIGYIDGFYDFATENTTAEHPDLTFKRLENDFPRVRSQIIPRWVRFMGSAQRIPSRLHADASGKVSAVL